jgi:hypothetical protein
MKALAIYAIQRSGTEVPASTEERPSIFDVDDREFRRLEKMGAVRVPTEHELKIAEAYAREEGEELTDLDAQPLERGMQAATVDPTGADGKEKTAAPATAPTPSVKQVEGAGKAAKATPPAGSPTTTTPAEKPTTTSDDI